MCSRRESGPTIRLIRWDAKLIRRRKHTEETLPSILQQLIFWTKLSSKRVTAKTITTSPPAKYTRTQLFLPEPSGWPSKCRRMTLPTTSTIAWLAIRTCSLPHATRSNLTASPRRPRESKAKQLKNWSRPHFRERRITWLRTLLAKSAPSKS